MTDGPRAGRGNFVQGTVAPGRERPGVGIVWLDRLAMVAGDRRRPPRDVAGGERAATVGAMVEVPRGYLVVDVRVGYATAAGGFVGELRVVDLGGHRKSALFLLEGSQAGDESASSLFVVASRAPTGKRTYLAIRASVADGADHVAVRELRLCVTQG